MFCLILMSLLFMAVYQTNGAIYSMNDSDYSRMPPIYYMDPYESCMEDSQGFYCTVDLTLVSDTPSSLLTMIQEYSEHTPKHFDHTKLRYSICVNKFCIDFLKEYETGATRSLEACLNESISKHYDLKIRVSESPRCHKNHEDIVLNGLDITVAVVCVMFLIINLGGSVYEIFSMKKDQDLNVVLCFSIQRNWRRLTAPPADRLDPRLKRLISLNCLKSVTTMFTIAGHSLLPFMLNGANPHFFERSYENLLYHIMYNGTIITQLYFIISGFLLVYNMQILSETTRIIWTFVPRAIALRWLRLTPAYGLVLAVTSTLLRYAGQGPLWQNVVNVEGESCRQEWMWNILYINNYIKNAQCMIQSWYLGADMQLSCLGVILFVAVTKEYHRNLALGILFLIGLMTPALHTYFQNLDGAILGTPETLRTLFVWYPTFYSVYKPGHTNIAGYTIGLAIGFFVYQQQKRNVDVKFKNLRFLVWSVVPVCLGFIVLTSVFYADRPRHSVYTRSIYASLSKPFYGLFMAVLIVGTVFKCEDLYRNLLEWRGWAVPSRLSYSAVLLHFMIIRIYTGTMTTLLHASFYHIIVVFISVVVLSYAAAVPFYLMVEAPMVHLVKLSLAPKIVISRRHTEYKTVDIELENDKKDPA